MEEWCGEVMEKKREGRWSIVIIEERDKGNHDRHNRMHR